MKHIVSVAGRRGEKNLAGQTSVFNENGLNKVGIIKAVRRATGLGLKEAKHMVELLNGQTYIEIETRGSTIPAEQAITELRKEGLDVTRSSNDPISLLRKAADLALAVDDVEMARDILGVVVKHQPS